MTWTINFDDRALKELRKLDKQAKKEILKYLRERVLMSDNPRLHGKALTSNMSGLWRYRVRDYRIVCDIQDNRLKILVIRVANRKDVYN